MAQQPFRSTAVPLFSFARHRAREDRRAHKGIEAAHRFFPLERKVKLKINYAKTYSNISYL